MFSFTFYQYCFLFCSCFVDVVTFCRKFSIIFYVLNLFRHFFLLMFSFFFQSFHILFTSSLLSSFLFNYLSSFPFFPICFENVTHFKKGSFRVLLKEPREIFFFSLETSCCVWAIWAEFPKFPQYTLKGLSHQILSLFIIYDIKSVLSVWTLMV